MSYETVCLRERSGRMPFFVLLLALALFLLFYALAGGPLPAGERTRALAVRLGPPAASAGLAFLAASALFGTPLAGLSWAALGWLLPGWIRDFLAARRRARLGALARDFAAAAAGMYAAGQTTPEVVRAAADEFPEPFRTDFADMVAERERNRNFSFPRAFRELAGKYGLPEFRAVAEILEASERAGGPRAAARGLERLGRALRQRDRLLVERAKALAEVKMAGYVVVGLLLAGLAADATALRHYFSEGSGKLAAGAASAFVAGLILMLRKFSANPDLEGGM